MSRMGELADAVSELKRCGETLIDVSEMLGKLLSSTEPDIQEPQVEEEQPKTEVRTLTLEEVRAVLADKSRMGFTAKIREILQRHGAEKLSEVRPEDYASILAEAEEIGNG